jgi:hypothetical protein
MPLVLRPQTQVPWIVFEASPFLLNFVYPLHSILQSLMQFYSSVSTLVQYVSATVGYHKVLLLLFLKLSHSNFALYMRTSRSA